MDTEALAALTALLEALGEQSSELRLELGGVVVTVAVKPAGDRRAALPRSTRARRSSWRRWRSGASPPAKSGS